MIFPIILFLSSWLCFLILADKKKFFHFAPTCYVTLIISLAADILIIHYPLWDYPAATKIQALWKHLMDDFGIYFVFTYFFLQALPKRKTIKTVFRHLFGWTLLAILIEWIALRTGNFRHGLWWNLGYSYLANWLLFSIFYGYYRLHNKYTQG